MSGREPTSAEFEPQRLTPPRRRLDPAILALAVVAIAIGVAIVKPWSGPASATVTSAVQTAGSAPSAVAESPDAASRPVPEPPGSTVATAPPLTWPTAAAAIRPHERWGVRAMVQATEPGSFERATGAITTVVERWIDATDAMRRSDGVAEEPLVLGTEQVVLALGLTFPRDDQVLEYQVWRATAEDTWTWLDLVPLEPRPASGTFLLGPPIIESAQPASWPTGRYRLEVLTTTGIQYLDLALPGRWDRVPAVRGPSAGRDPLHSPFSPSFAGIEGAGPFVVEDGLARSIASGPANGDEPDLATLWRDGTGATHAPRASGIGLMLPTGTRELSATLHRVGLDGGPAAARRVTGLRFADGRSPFVIFRALRGAAWEPGTYRIDAAWTEGADRRTAAYHVLLRPGAAPEAGSVGKVVPG